MAKISATKRLLELLQQIRAVSSRQGTNARVSAVLGQILGYEPTEKEKLQHGYLQLAALVRSAEDEIRSFYTSSGEATPEEAQALADGLRPVQQIRDAVFANSLHSRATALAQFPLNDLAILASTITAQSGEHVLEDHRLRDAKAAAVRAQELLFASGMPGELKSLLLAHLAAVVAAIDHYRTFGPEAILDAVAILYARAGTREPSAGQADRGKIREVLAVVADIFTIASSAWLVANGLQSGPTLRLTSGDQ